MIVTVDAVGKEIPLVRTHREPRVVTARELSECYDFLRKLIGIPAVGARVKTNELVGGDRWNWAENGFPIEAVHEGYYRHFHKYVGKAQGYCDDGAADEAAVHQAGVMVGHLVRNILDDMKDSSGNSVVFRQIPGYTATYSRIR